MIILLFILYLFLFILLLALFFMSIPYKYLLYYSYTENLYFKMSISTFFFSFAYSKEEQKESTYIKVFSFKKEFEKKSSEKETEDKKLKDKIKEKVKKKSKKEKKKKKSGIPFSIIRYENIKHIFQLLIDLLKMIIPKHLRLYFLIGLEEPHLNGWLIASYYSLKGIYPKLPINIDIDWEKENYESNGELSGYIIPIKLVARILVFIFSVKTIKILWKVFKYKRSK